MYITISDEGKQIEHYESLSEYKDMHPEDFSPIIPISLGTAEMIVVSESVAIEELPFDDVVIHPHK
jgi:hypothetical protein